MAHRKRTRTATRKPAATNSRSFRTFLLVAQFEAKEIGERIALARELAGLTQRELAEIASFSLRSLQDYEGGVTIPYKHFRELARLLRKPEEWFLYGDQEPPASAEAVTRLSGEVAELRGRVDVLLDEIRQGRALPGR